MTRMYPVLMILLASLFLASTVEARPRHETPEKLYEQGIRQMKRGYYDEAIISFDKVRNHFPLNQFSVLAELRVADCLYERADYISAVDAYQQFTRLHPRHDEVDYAHMRVGRAYFKQANKIPAKDQTYTELTLRSLGGFEDTFADSEYLTEVLEMRGKCRNRLSRAELQVGDFYYWRKSYNAASRRYEGILANYEDCEIVARARYKLGMSYSRLGDQQAALRTLQQVQDMYPESNVARRASRNSAKILEKLTDETFDAPIPDAPIPDEPATEE